MGAGVIFPIVLLAVWIYGFIGFKINFLPVLDDSLNFGDFKDVTFVLGLILIAVVSF